MAEIETEFHRILLQISDGMSEEDLGNMKYMVGALGINKTKLDSAKAGHEMFDLLEKGGFFHSRKTEPLEKLLQDIRLGNAAENLKKFARARTEKSVVKLKTAPTNLNSGKIVKHFKQTQKLKELKDRMEITNFVTLKGLLGSGKSQMALKYGCEYKDLHPESVVWKLNCKDMASLQTSLKDLCTNLDIDIKTEMDENKETMQSIEDFGKKVVNVLKEMKGVHLLLLDDLMEDTCRCLQDFIEECRKNIHVKVIATTFHPFFIDSTLEVDGFSPEEAVEFLSEGKRSTEKDKEGYLELAKRYGFLPLGLYCARTYIRHLHYSPMKFNKICATSNLCKIEESHCIVDNPEVIIHNKTLFKCLLQLIEILHKNENEKVFDMILSLQFLETDDIPVILFDFLPPATMEPMEIDNLIQALQTFSFGKLDGEDDERVLSTHYAFVTALKIFSGQGLTTLPDQSPAAKGFCEKKKTLLKQLLKAFMYVMDKDNRSKADFRRNKMMANHAKSLLHHADSLLIHDVEFLMSMIYVNDLVGYTYNFDGILNLAAYHSNKAKQYCFVLLEIDESEFENQLEDQATTMENIGQMNDSCKERARHIFNALQNVASCEKIVLENFAKEYILNKHRVEDDIVALSDILSSDLEKEKQLTEGEYNALCEREYAVPLYDISSLFLYELILATLYTHGRRIFYLIKPIDRQKARKFCSYLYIAYHLGQQATEQYPKWKCLYAMLTERSGTLQQCIDDHSMLGQHTIETFNNIASRCEEMLQESVRYYVFGIFKTDTQNDEHYKAIWLKQLIRCYRNMIGLAQNEEEKNNVIVKGRECASRLQNSLSSMENRTPFPSLQFSVGEFYECIGEISEAEKIIEKLCPKNILESKDELSKEKLAKYEKKACIMLIKCLCKNNKLQLVKGINSRLNEKLSLSQDHVDIDDLVEIQRTKGLTVYCFN